MKTLCTHARMCRGIVGLLVAAAAMACSGATGSGAPGQGGGHTGGRPVGD